MRHSLKPTLFILLILLSACGKGSDALPTPIPHNTEWIPVIREFNDVEMVLVPAGCFTMGHAKGRRDEQPEHEICFERPFWIDRYEVTNQQYGSPGVFPGENQPRTNLTWYDARDFCLQRGARLPTEAEWEYAARGPDSLLYPWGNEFDPDALIYDSNFGEQPADVGTHPRGISWVGAYDLAGNVWEWVNSVYRPYPYSANDGRETDSSAERRVYRGGLGSYIDYGASAASRFRGDPFKTDWFLGFRCARDN